MHLFDQTGRGLRPKARRPEAEPRAEGCKEPPRSEAERSLGTGQAQAAEHLSEAWPPTTGAAPSLLRGISR